MSKMTCKIVAIKSTHVVDPSEDGEMRQPTMAEISSFAQQASAAVRQHILRLGSPQIGKKTGVRLEFEFLGVFEDEEAADVG